MVEGHHTCKYPSPASRQDRRWRVEDEAELAWSCESCTAGVIADCVAVCCCPCGVVEILALALLKLPYAVARRLYARARNKKKCQSTIICNGNSCGGDMDGISEKTRGNLVLSAPSLEAFSDDDYEGFSSTEAVWFDLCEFGHLGFGRVS